MLGMLFWGHASSLYISAGSLYKLTDSLYKSAGSLYKLTDSLYKSADSLYKLTDSLYKSAGSLYKLTGCEKNGHYVTPPASSENQTTVPTARGIDHECRLQRLEPLTHANTIRIGRRTSRSIGRQKNQELRGIRSNFLSKTVK